MPGEVVGLVGGNGAGQVDADARPCRARTRRTTGEILIDGKPVTISNPRDAKALGIETIYQTLALADNVDAAANMFLGRELTTRFGSLDDAAMESATRKVMGRLNPRFKNFKTPVMSLSGGQRQSVAIARAIHFNARILIMDEPTAALGPAETAQVRDLVKQLKDEGIGIFLISHDIHDVFDLSDRISVMLHGKLVGTVEQGGRHDRRGPRDDHHRQAAGRGHPEGAGRAPRLRRAGADATGRRVRRPPPAAAARRPPPDSHTRTRRALSTFRVAGEAAPPISTHGGAAIATDFGHRRR